MAAEAVEAVSATSVNRSIINNVKNEQCSRSGSACFWASRNRIRNHLYGSGSRSRQLVKILFTPCMAAEAVEAVSDTSVKRSIIKKEWHPATIPLKKKKKKKKKN
jgi:hypothetical protein